MGFFTQMLTPAQLAQLAQLAPIQHSHTTGDHAMNSADRSLLNALTTQVCDALDALTDALREVRDELRATQTEPGTWEKATREHVLVPPPPPIFPAPPSLLDPSL
jgi:hypothetical protein